MVPGQAASERDDFSVPRHAVYIHAIPTVYGLPLSAVYEYRFGPGAGVRDGLVID